jgi:CTP synthase
MGFGIKLLNFTKVCLRGSKLTRFIFVTGGVLSSLGKGIAAASLAALLQARGFSVRIRKLDPYINVDPGTMSPYQHGEVFVTEDGAETDLDLGHYERFTGVNASKADNITTGRIYHQVITKERRGDYLGGTVQVIPHITDEIKNFIRSGIEDLDFLICEVGGTVGDIEGLPFIEAIRQFGNEVGRARALYIHLTLMPYIASAGELKTKPSQHSVKELLGLGIQPDILLCRCDRPISEGEREKLSLFCNLPKERVIEALDVSTIYQVPLSYHEKGLDLEVCKYFGIKSTEPSLGKWKDIVHRIQQPEGKVKIAIVAKYSQLKDAYKSLIEALIHGGIANNIEPELHWFDSEELEKKDGKELLQDMDGILVPGGFGIRGSEGKIQAARYARENYIPYFGICFGLQMAVIEFARHVLHLEKAGSSEFGPCALPLVGLMKEWATQEGLERRTLESDLGGTMRLGAYPCVLQPGTRIFDIYEKVSHISERHRHRYEVDISYKNQFEAAGMLFSGISPDGKLPEIIELKDHPWFVAVQFHPELKSRPFHPHPLFISFIEASLKYSRLV